MTYNFDAERWHEDQRALLEARHERGELSDAEFTAVVEELDRKYDAMVARLDGTFQLPGR